MKKYISIPLVSLVCCLCMAQQRPTEGGQKNWGGNPNLPSIGHIYGKVVDSKTKESVPFASVAIFKKDSVIAGNFTKNNGEFSFENLPYGRFNLKITFLGFKAYQQVIMIIPQNEEQDLGDIQLQVEETLLKTVEVVEEKSAFEMNIDRKVFNVDKNITSRGGTATDVMKNIPSVTMDESGNAQLRQNNATIYVDGRPTNLTLDMIPADQIDKVEVITNPSAKFEASATGGIINIVMKSNLKPGYNGVVTGGAGTNDHYNGMLALNVKQKPIGFSATYSYNTFKNPIHAYNYRTMLNNGSTSGHYDSDNNKVFRNTFNTGTASLDYYINNRNTLTISQNITKGYFYTREDQSFRTSNATDALLSRGSRITNTVIDFGNYTTKLHYKKTFPKKGKEFSADINYNGGLSQNPSVFTTNTYDGNGTLLPLNPALQNNKGRNENQTYTIQTDYINPVNDSTKLELGLRSSIKQSDQLMEVNRYDHALDLYAIDIDLTNHYLITDIVNAGYINYSMRRKKLSYMLGLRFEESYYKGVLANKNDSTFQYSYPTGLNNIMNALFPGIFISKKIAEKKEIQFNISRKINRPNFRQMMPFIMSSDNKNYSIGNPNLTPEFITMAELNYNQQLTKGNLLLTLFIRNTQNPLTQYNYTFPADSSIVISTHINGRQSNTIGMDNTFKHTLFKGFEATWNLNLFYSFIDATYKNTTVSNQGFNYTTKLNLVYRLPQNFSIQLSGNYHSPKVIPQGTSKEQYFADCGVSKEIKKFITLTFSVSDIFDTKGQGNLTTTDDYIQDYWSRRETRYVKFTAMIRFGKADVTMFKRKSGSQQSDSEGEF